MGAQPSGEMIAAGVSVMETWAVEQDGLVSPFFESLVASVWLAMERKRRYCPNSLSLTTCVLSGERLS